jgi:hypothetical protein
LIPSFFYAKISLFINSHLQISKEGREVSQELIDEHRRRIYECGWFSPELKSEVEEQLRLADTALSMNLGGRARAHFIQVRELIERDEKEGVKQLKEQEEQASLEAAEREEARLIAVFREHGVPARPMRVTNSTENLFNISWTERERTFILRRSTRKARGFFDYARSSIDADDFGASQVFYQMVGILRDLGIEDSRVFVFHHPQNLVHGVLAIQAREPVAEWLRSEPYILVAEW